MTKQQIVKLGIDEGIAGKIVQMNKNEFKSYVPKERFNEVNESKKQAQEQLKLLKDVAKEKQGLLEQMETMRRESKSLEDWYEEQLFKARIDKAIFLKLAKARVKNINSVYALLNFDGLKLGKDGSVIGLDEQIEMLIESDDSKFLFAKEEKTFAMFFGNM